MPSRDDCEHARGHLGLPVAASGDFAMSLQEQPRMLRTYCRICVAACGLVVETDGTEIFSLRGDREHAVSEGYTCAKGRGLAVLHTHPDRLDRPLLRRADGLHEASWPEVLDDASARIRSVLEEHGPGSVAIFMGAGGFTEAAGYVTARRFARALGLAGIYSDFTIDSPNKPVVAALITGWNALTPKIHRESAGFVLFIGCNPIVSHGHTAAITNPVEFLRQIQSRGGQVWVIDPRRTETAHLADGHLAPRPGTDYALLAYVVRELLRGGADEAYLRENSVGRDALARAVEPFTLAVASDISGVSPESLEELVAAIRGAGRIAFETGTGVSMSAAANVTEWLAWVLAIVTGSMERPGGIWFNPGYLGRFDERTIKQVPRNAVPDPGPTSRPELPTWFGEYPSVALVDELESGNIRALLDFGGNLITCLPDTKRVVSALQQLDVLLVAEIARTPTTEVATHVFACRDQLERADLPYIFDRSASRMYTQYTPAVVEPKGDRRALWWSLGQLAQRLDLTVLPHGIDLDTATDDDMLRTLVANTAVSFEDLVTADGPVLGPRAVFGWARERVLRPEGYDLAPHALVEQLTKMAPPEGLVMINHRQANVYNGQVRAARTPNSFEILVHPDDAAAAGLGDGDRAVVRSSAGELVGKVRLDDATPTGTIAIPHGWADANVNALISASDHVDSLTGMARMSGTSVTIARAG